MKNIVLIFCLFVSAVATAQTKKVVVVKLRGTAGSGGSGSVEYVKGGYGTKVDSAGRAYTVRVDTLVVASKDYVNAKDSLKQDNIILTTNDRTGAATLAGRTLNIPRYAGNDSAYIKFTVLNDSNIVFKRINGGLDTLTLVGNGAGGGAQNLQSVTSLDSTTTTKITAKTFKASGIANYNNNTEAIAAGLQNGDMYRLPYNSSLDAYLIAIVYNALIVAGLLNENGTTLLNEDGTTLLAE